MTETARLAEKLKAEGEKFAAQFAALSDDQWLREVYSEGAVWTVRSVLAHWVTSERAFVRLFDSILHGGAGVSEDFVIDRYNASQQEKTKDLGPAELLQEYQSGRARMIAWVSALGDADLDKTGRHPFLGVTTLREMVKLVYIHNQTHFRDVRKALG